jgi:hypothetical protein
MAPAGPPWLRPYPEGQAALGKTEGRRPRGVLPAWLEKEGQEEGASKARCR